MGKRTRFFIEEKGPGFFKKLEPELDEITSIALSLPVQQLRSILSSKTDSSSVKWELKTTNCSVAAWMEARIVFDDKVKETELPLFSKDYKGWCEETGETFHRPKAFAVKLREHCRNNFDRNIDVLNGKGKPKRNNRGTLVRGIRLATSVDPMPDEQLTQPGVENGVESSQDATLASKADCEVSSANERVETVSESVESVQDATLSTTLAPQPFQIWSVESVEKMANNSFIYTDAKYADDIAEIIKSMCLCESKEALITRSKAYGVDDPGLKQRVWAKMTPEQQDKIKAIANSLPNGVEVGRDYAAVNGDRLRLLEVFEHTTREGDIILMGRCEYLSDGAACETRLDFLRSRAIVQRFCP